MSRPTPVLPLALMGLAIALGIVVLVVGTILGWRIEEDSPLWVCWLMGNGRCGP